MQGSGVETRRLSANAPKLPIWLLVAIGAFITAALWLSGYQRWYFIPALFAILVWDRLSLCEVTLEGRELRISNYRGEVIVPLTAVDSVKERRGLRHRGRIVLFLDRNFGIGRKIEFVPHQVNRNLTGDGPVTAELKKLVADAMREQELGARHRV